ncbi:Choline kinase [Cytospora mali]|uniref:Choline kinase n=1 Tax=Cytospora mali TaxID=578113 RepID=A0A194UWJ8_CYTMA|nr:Choline kinase [Valsa mali var. pyri (nom. inval.)]
MPTTPLNAQGQPIRPALKTEDDATRTPPNAPVKAVHIAEPEPLPPDEPRHKREFAASVSGKRLSGRPPMPSGNSSRTSFISQNSIESLELNGNQSVNSLSQLPEDSTIQGGQQQQPPNHHSHRIDRASEKLLSQVADWLQREKTKRETKKPRKHHHHHHLRRKLNKPRPEEGPASEEAEAEAATPLRRTTSIDSNSSDVSLDRLQRILDDSMAALGLNSMSHYGAKLGRRSSHRKKLTSRSAQHLARAASSDTDFHDGDVLVPSCDAVLDNSNTLKYSQAGPDDSVSISSKREEKEKQAWITFRNEIIRLAHTLRLKGWRRVALDSGDEIQVERLSGALTNAVYVVTPPENLPPSEVSKKKPQKVLLRIYGPQVEHLIDRDNELSILKRLARKKIGPRLLGTFTNGRFEQFFNAAPLTPEALRESDTSKKIAKRMRELHDGIDLLEEEKDEGPTVFKNWDNWVDNVERRTLFLDQLACRDPDAPVGPADAWKKCGFVCGMEWPKFKAMVDKYREFLIQYYGPTTMREKLIFAHNDTQYGNILRVLPDDEKSPLMHPENEHKQLIVIDFEYASANTPGLEFANHFTEWAYNYHDPHTPYACNVEGYPTLEEQRRFLKAYVEHRPKFATSVSSANSEYDITPGATPQVTPQNPSSSIVEFMLDARVPPGGWNEEERRAAELSEEKIRELLKETRVWRAMNSAQWVAWGIVQAKIPGYVENTPDNNDAPVSPVSSVGTVTEDLGSEVGSAGGCGGGDEEEGFDYLSYAHERALFFWGDCVQMGLVKLEDLPERLRERVKIVEY